MSNSIAPGKRVSRTAGFISKTSTRRVHEMMDELGLGDQVKECFEFVRDAMRGQIRNPADPTQFVYVPIKDRIDCAIWLAEKKTGKAVASIDVSHSHNHRHKHDLTLLTGTDLDVVEAALVKMEALSPGELQPSDLHGGEHAASKVVDVVEGSFAPDTVSGAPTGHQEREQEHNGDED